MAKRVIYAWGTERPSARKKRFTRRQERVAAEIKAEEAAYAARLEAERLGHEARVALIRAKEKSLADACDAIDRCLDGRGAYKFDHGETEFTPALPGVGRASTRSRGRPRQFWPGAPPPMPTAQAASGQAARPRSPSRARSRAASPAPHTPRQTRRSKGLHPLATTLTAAAIAHLAENDNHPAPPTEVVPKKEAPTFGDYDGVDTALAYEEAQRQQKAADHAAIVAYEVTADEIAAARADALRHRAGIPYDLSNATCWANIPQELWDLSENLEAVCELPVAADLIELSDRELKQWCNAAAYQRNPIDLTVDKDIKHDVDKLYGGVRAFLKDAIGRDVANAITAERFRREAWGWANRRLHQAAALSCELLDGRDLEEVLDELALFDFRTEAALTEQSSAKGGDTPPAHKQYIAIIDALRWPVAFSRREVVVRARPEHNPARPLPCSPFDGPAKHLPDWRRHPQQPRPEAVDIALDQLRVLIPPPLPLPSDREAVAMTGV